MHHDFFGNTGTSASSTATSLVGGRTTCSTSADASAYWVPVLYQNGKALTPKSSLIYWKQDSSLASATKTVPAGLQMIAGDEAATGPQSVDVAAWSCQAPKKAAGGQGGKGLSATPRTCTGNAQLKLTMHFPNCWDGHTLSGAKQTNVVYAGSSGCPASHPVEIPQIVFHTVYPTASAAGLRLSMTPDDGRIDRQRARRLHQRLDPVDPHRRRERLHHRPDPLRRGHRTGRGPEGPEQGATRPSSSTVPSSTMPSSTAARSTTSSSRLRAAALPQALPRLKTFRRCRASAP